MPQANSRRRRKSAKWLRTVDVALILGCNRQHVTWLARRGRGQTDPALYLLGEEKPSVTGARKFWRFDKANVLAFRDGQGWAKTPEAA
ncbi:hypothetical protein [Frankia sp. AgW1.1]|uniref:hypothetical protein n=1 Tax=Frankia sp. AgW1.1 TaxID=1836971 RepID=UPI001931CA31|nr:hypothetical protein [Frankia sp. AgW1.1]MBL7487165.1 hypothetical protein [Frankia sp. AgW1.1]